ncbi:Mannosyl-oligosaccharide 1,2-alpha-mannosidase IC [Sphaceloma murrayae]|uniref:alpha-1,2-Mannosidase n=1 Tax=Sphaceloma murrayae TaxID=2082308 RepID=A0A2K1R1Z7_9PEZI|nr:Mannosyl-oligosaccharide 1,2-alpha-mannosidase IC [Sphaceloma murrayae]
MLRYRRYRAFVVFTIFAIFGVYYYFASDGTWQPSSISTPSLKQLGSIVAGTQEKAQAKLGENDVDNGVKPDLGGERKPEPTKKAKPTHEDDEDPEEEPSHLHGQEKDHSKAVSTPGKGSKSESGKEAADGKSPSVDDLKAGAGRPDQKKPKVVIAPEYETNPGSGRQDDFSRPRPVETVHWSKQPENFPISSTIALPTGTPKAIPQIQFNFKKESEAEKTDRLQKLSSIKNVAQMAWRGYRDQAWGHDEVRPISGNYKDPFGGWAATLVDSLDTLWIMGMKQEFEEAVARVGKIDFTVCEREDIPLFETTIRYLGGLLSAYDISGAKHKVLLDKAVELGEVLMGAFDTPNRMPVTFYYWKPSYASQPHRAGTNVVMAELGSLSMEFTRLAQLTMENKYYDAIDRITDAFYEWQTRETNQTWLPGLFPLNVDASGCDAPQQISNAVSVLPPQEPIMENMPKIGSTPQGDARMDMGETGLSQKPKNMDTTKRPAVVNEDAEDTLDAASKPLHMGEPGRSKIVGWNDPVKEGALDDKTSKEKLLAGKTSDMGSAPSKLQDKASKKEPLDDALPSEDQKGAKAAANPSTADSLARSRPKEVDALEAGAPKLEKRQLGNTLAEEVEDEVRSAASKGDDTQRIEVKKSKAMTDKSTASEDGKLGAGANDNIPVSGGAGARSHAQSPDEQLMPPNTVDPAVPQCVAQNLTSSTKQWGRDTFSLGGRADSTYEYFPKQYLLLGGLEDKYRKLYENSMDVATKYLLFQPLTPDNADILIAGEYEAWSEEDTGKVNGTLSPTASHLGCFAGGMYALGAKIFDRPADLKIAARLTEGCVWAYAATKTGIMPEFFELLPCESKTDCEWNKTRYYEALDPNREFRMRILEDQAPLTPAVSDDDVDSRKIGTKVKDEELEKYNSDKKKPILDMGSSDTSVVTKGKGSPKEVEKSRDKSLSKSDAKNPQNIADDSDAKPQQKNPQKIADDFDVGRLNRRQLSEGDERPASRASKSTAADDEDEDEDPDLSGPEDDDIRPGKPVKYGGNPGGGATPTATETVAAPVPAAAATETLPVPEYTPAPPPTHEEYVKSRIEEERLPGGFIRLTDRRYILRPEAIESVWYMYRITGDVHWRKVGWTMFKAVSDHTRGVYGNSAIDDVTKTLPEKLDSQESFWLAETLKYFFLLFSDEGVVSLDEWVLNTEAHPFRRPLPPKKKEGAS